MASDQWSQNNGAVNQLFKVRSIPLELSMNNSVEAVAMAA